MSGQGNESASKTVFVGSLSEEVNNDLLKAAFIPFGPIKSIELPIDRIKAQHRGFGFVEFEELEDAQMAIKNMHNAELFGRILRVNMAKPSNRPNANPNKPVWAEDFFYRQQLAKEGIEVDEAELEKPPTQDEKP